MSLNHKILLNNSVLIEFKSLKSLGKRFHNLGAANWKALSPSLVRDFSGGNSERFFDKREQRMCPSVQYLYHKTIDILSFLYVCMVNTIYLLSFVETPRKFIIAELSIRKLLLALMKIRAYGSKALQ